MPDKKISDLGDGGAPQDPDDFVVARGGTNVKLAWSSLSAVAASNQIAVTLDGNTAGALAPMTSGTVTLAGGNNITLSQVGNAVTISGPNAGGAQTGISSIGNSETTYSSGAIELVNTGAITIASNAGQQFVFSVDPQSVQPETQTFIGGISASDTLYTSGSVRISGAGAATVKSGTGQLVIVDVATQSVQPETQTFIAGISASDTAYTSGTVRITGVGGGVTVSSNTGQRIDISVAAQSVQPETQTFVAGISASDTLYTSGNVRFTGVGGGVTISSNTGQRVDISVAAQSVQPETQTFIAGVSASDTLYTSGNVRITGVGGGITVSSNTGQRIDLSVAAQSVQPETQTFIGGISASNTLYTSGSVRFTGSGAVTVRSGTGQLVVIDSPTQTTQVETQTFIGGLVGSNATYTSGTVSITGVGGGITVSSNTGQRIDLSVAAQSAQTQGILAVGASTGGNTSGDTGVASGTRLVLVGSNGITVSQGTAANATTLTLSGVTQTVQTQGGFVSLGVSTGGNTIGNTQVSTGTRFVLVASGNLTASQATGAGASTVTLSVAAQTVQTQNMVAVSATNTLYSSGTVLFTGSNMITVKSSGAGQTVILDATQTVQTQGVLSAGVSTGGNTSGNTTVNTGSRLVFAGGNNITLSQGTAAGATTITISAPNLGAGAMSAGVSTGGNTAGATGITGTQLVFVGSDNITLSQTTGANGGTVSIIGPSAGGFSAGMSTEGNTAGATGVTGTRMVLVGSGPVSLSQTTGAAGGTVSINAPATSSLSATGAVSISTNASTISIGVPYVSAAEWENMPIMQAVLYTHISGVSKTPFYWPENVPALTPANIAFRVSMVTASADLSLSAHFGVYTFVNSTSIALLGSASDAFVVSAGSSVSFSAQRQLILTSPGTVAAISNMTPGNYVFGMMFSASATGAMNASIYAASGAAGPRVGRIMPGTNQLSTATSQGIAGLYGRGSTTVNAMPANVVASEVVNQGIAASSPMKPHIFIRS